MLKNKSLGGKIKYLLLMLILIVAFVNGYDMSLNAPEGQKYENQQEQDDAGDSGDEGDIGEEGTSGNAGDSENAGDEANEDASVTEDGTYTSKEEVAEYIHLYEKLPSNFITKKQAQKLGWESSKGNLDKVAPGKSIGGDYFGNYEGNLPEKDGRDYYECDINYEGGYRGSERIVYSDDGLIYYTADHYETFELLYGEE